MKGKSARRDLSAKRAQKVCSSCLFVSHTAEDSRDNCLRFARFVDHALHGTSRDCDYWTAAPER